MKIFIFCVGLTNTTAETCQQMLQSTTGKEDLSEFIDSPEGVGIYAAGAHIIHMWMSTIPLEEVKPYCMFLRLASKEPEFAVHLSEIQDKQT